MNRALLRSRSALIGLAALLILLGLRTGPILAEATQRRAFLAKISDCNLASHQLRFSCYRSALEAYGASAEKAHRAVAEARIFEDRNADYAVFGTSCHSFYHALGDYIAQNAEGEADQLLAQCPKSCTSGCAMGLYKRLALQADYSEDLLSRFQEICREGENHQCAHELGHILHDKYVNPLLELLDRITFTEYGIAPRQEYDYVSFDEPDLNQPFRDCVRLAPEGEVVYCFTGVGHNLFLFGEFDPNGFAGQFQQCARVAEHQDKCFKFLVYRIGINHAAPAFLANDFERGREICRESAAAGGEKELMRDCYIGVGGGIGLFVDSEFSLSTSSITEANLPRVKQEILGRARLCEGGEEGYVDDCYRGLMGTKFLEFYRMLGIRDETIEAIFPTIEGVLDVVG